VVLRRWRPANLAAGGNRPGEPVLLVDSVEAGVGYGDLQASPDGGWLVCVRERIGEHGNPGAEVIAVGGDGGEPAVLTGGWDFAASPRLSLDGRSLAWLSWRDPLLPWEGTWLWTSTIHSGQTIGGPEPIAGGPDESVLQPEWGADGSLYFLSDRSGWWNLYRHHAGRVEPVATADTEMAAAPWELGYRSYAFLPGGRIAVLLQNGPRHQLAIRQPDTGRLDPVSLPYTSIKPYLAADGWRLAFIAASPTQTSTVVVLDTATGELRELAGGTRLATQPYISVPKAVTIPTRDGATAHGLYYPPTNPDVTPPAGQLPPLIVRAHPGPTANTTLRLDPAVQFFTSRGYAILDLDYRGSTGYGRAYRQALNGHWGVLDATDCIDAADHLTATGRADPTTAYICGASAGGYTALRALATTNRFTAGTARSAIIDPATWRRTVPRFQRHHTTALIGAWPEHADRYRERSVLHHSHRIHAPVLLLHGERDHIAPTASAVELAARLHAAGTPCTLHLYPGQGHTLRSHTTVAAALNAELAHYQHTRPSEPS